MFLVSGKAPNGDSHVQACFGCCTIKIPRQTEGISVSAKTLNVTGDSQVRFRLACQLCNCYLLPVNGLHHKPPLCKGRWLFRKKMTEGLLLTPLCLLPFVISFNIHNPSVSFADSSLYTREPLTQNHPAVDISILLQELFYSMSVFMGSVHTGYSLFRPTRLSRGFRYTKKKRRSAGDRLFSLGR